jgi:hypothetical protein
MAATTVSKKIEDGVLHPSAKVLKEYIPGSVLLRMCLWCHTSNVMFLDNISAHVLNGISMWWHLCLLKMS